MSTLRISLYKIQAIVRKELNAYFKSPTAYIVLCITLSVFNVFFFIIMDQNREATLRDMFTLMEFMFVFIVPVLTMSVFAEEKRAGTLEFLMTCPIKNSSIVIGKYLASLIFLMVLIGCTLTYYLILEVFSDIDHIATIAGYIGMVLEGAVFIAIGILISSWTHNQLIAALGTYGVLFLLYFSIIFIKYLPETTHSFVRALSIWSHTENLAAGVVNISDITYYFSLIAFCLLLTLISIDNKLWK